VERAQTQRTEVVGRAEGRGVDAKVGLQGDGAQTQGSGVQTQGRGGVDVAQRPGRGGLMQRIAGAGIDAEARRRVIEAQTQGVGAQMQR
jgi:hypothetical protein